MMTMLIVILVILTLGVFLIYAGVMELERRAARLDRFERWMHPPDDDDGVSILEDDRDADD